MNPNKSGEKDGEEQTSPRSEPDSNYDPLNDSINDEMPEDSPLASSSESETLHKQQGADSNSHQRSPRTLSSPSSFMMPASPPKFVSMEEIMKAAEGVSNMALAHEIAVNNEFRLEKTEDEGPSMEKQVREVMHRAFWDSLHEKLNEDPPDYRHAIILLAEVKEALLDILLPQHQKLRNHIDEVLDLELIVQKAEHDAVDIHYYANFVIDIMSKLCAPVRDEEVEALTQTKDIVPLFREIFRVLDLMKMDMANFTIQQIRPFIQKQSVAYESKKFEEFLKTQEENNLDGLLYTKEWLTRSEESLQPSNKPTPGGTPTATPGGTPTATPGGTPAATPGGTPASPPTPAAIINHAYVELLNWNEENVMPETLVMDMGRFIGLRDQVRRLTLVSSILLVTYNTVGPAIAGISDFKAKLKDEILIILGDTPNSEIESVIVGVSEHVVKEVNACLEKHGFAQLDASRQNLVKGQVQSVLPSDHPVHKLIRSRILGFVEELISSPKPGDIKFPPGVSTVAPELNHICGQFWRLITHNRSTFGEYYANIISSLLQRHDEV